MKTPRCKAVHPMYPKQVRCEKPKGHDGQHGHSFFARYWDDEPSLHYVEGVGTCYGPIRDGESE